MCPRPSPGPKQALVRIAASGVNFIDVYFRIGLYKADLPITLGNEGAGIVEAVGPEVTEVAARRPRGLCHGARLLCRVRRGSGGDPGEDSRITSISRPPRPPCCRA